MLIKSFLLSAFTILLTNFVYSYLHLGNYLSDIGGLGAFATVFGTLNGIMTAFIVFEVWAQYGKIAHLVGQEALGLERLFRLTLNFKDNKLSSDMKNIISQYADLIIKSKFKRLAEGERNMETSKAFRKISQVIRQIRCKSDQDRIVFDQVIEHYENLAQIRTERVDQSLVRLPMLLKLFLYISSLFTLLVFIFMPFVNIYYAFLVVGMLTFIISMVILLVEDLDNPLKVTGILPLNLLREH